MNKKYNILLVIILLFLLVFANQSVISKTIYAIKDADDNIIAIIDFDCSSIDLIKSGYTLDNFYGEKPVKEIVEPEAKKEEPIQEVEVKETLSQQQALRKAKDYLDYTSFSKKGLIDQLKYEGFNTEDATYAVDKIKVSWKEQAVKKAKDYLDYSAFSRQGLIDQLIYDGFSKEDATYAVDKIGLK
ncbi:MAG: Ltp family lipoprotein [Candidatus Caldatribacteriota bacterium]